MIGDTVERIKAWIGTRAYAYKRVFTDENHYSKIVLVDLAKFCKAHKSTYHSDPRLAAAQEGRREVFLRIQEFLNLTDTQLFELHQVKHIPQRSDHGAERK